MLFLCLFFILLLLRVDSFCKNYAVTGQRRLLCSALVDAPVADLDVKELLKTMLSSRSSLDEKKKCYKTVIDLRSKENGEFEIVLDEMLGFVDGVKGNPICARRLPFPLPSFRVKVGSLRRLLQSSTNIKSQNQEDEQNKIEKRRGLLIILGQLVRTEEKNTNIRFLEEEALRRSKKADMTEMLRRTPTGLETPTYTVIQSKGIWEVQTLPPTHTLPLIHTIHTRTPMFRC